MKVRQYILDRRPKKHNKKLHPTYKSFREWWRLRQERKVRHFDIEWNSRVLQQRNKQNREKVVFNEFG